MYSYYSPYAFLSFLLIIIINLFVDLPISFCADDPNYLACNQPFKCGDIENITYPFWTSDRPENCGHPDFKLECPDDNSAEIEFQSQTYRVVSIDHDDQKLRLATTTSWENNCPTDNISFPSNGLRYLDPLNQNITLFYQCPFIPELAATNKFVCSVNNTNENYFWRDSVGEFHPELSRCKLNVTVTFNQTLFGLGSQLNLGNILNEGFDVLYAVNASLCKECEGSGGACVYDRDTAQPKCFCLDGPSDGRCLTNRPASQPTVQPVNINIPMFLGEDDYRYTSCNSTFECGNIISVEYPFWGGKRPSHCGYPDFKLECLEDGDTRIDVNSRFRVLDINQENQTLRLTRRDVSGDLCSLRPANTSFNLDKLHYAPYDVNFTICYGCPSTNRSPLSCKLNNSDLFTSIHTAISSRLEQNPFYTSCRLCIEIPILQEAIDRRRFDPLIVEDASIVLEVLRDGFDVQYDGNVTYCSDCKNSGGQCGYDWTSRQFNCFCTYGFELTKCSVEGKGTYA
ncbi:hypothetical protein AQUCO_04100074v1 [Aquilegia coerulea]|uniref:EGF-like domain-containing protein n=1 Tax=Aquilegia coerulea TaxID=218851 RepID=A0A2G5CQ56_AQUCA|nr:hypothetical protein AQUCO_04100074v1 [Aquilegia coerulea]